MFKFFTFIAFLSITSCCVAQDYIITQSAYKQGRIVRSNKKEIFVLMVGSNSIAFGAKTTLEFQQSEVLEYKQGRTVYEALNINGERVFRQRLIKGRASLYYHRDTYWIRIDSGEVAALEKSNFRSVLSAKLQCEGSDPSLQKLSWTNTAIEGIVKAYNKGACSNELIPHRKIGVIAGYNLMTLKADAYNASMKSEVKSPSFGITFDAPLLFRKAGRYVTADLLYQSYKATLSETKASQLAYTSLEMNGVVANAGFKFIRAKGAIQPYLKIGGQFSIMNFKSSSDIIVISIQNTEYYSSQNEINQSKFSQLSVYTGLGAHIPVASRKNIHVELRYAQSVSPAIENLRMETSALSIMAAFNF